MKTNPSPSAVETAADYSERIRAERVRRALSQEALAEKAGLSARTVQRAECGETPAPETLRALAAALGVTLESLAAKAPRRFFRPGFRSRGGWTGWVLFCLAFTLVTVLTPHFNGKAILYLMAFFYDVNLPWLVTGFRIEGGRLLVHHVGWAKSYDLGKATGAARCPQAKLGPLPVFSFYFTVSGLHYNKLLGFFRAYITDCDKTVLVEFGRKKIVVTPDDPDEFLASLKDEAKAGSGERELAVPTCLAGTPRNDTAEKLRTKRNERGLTQEALAARAGVNVRTIQRLENGAVPSRETLRLLAQALGAEVADFGADTPRTAFGSPWSRTGAVLGAAAGILLGVTGLVLVLWLDPRGTGPARAYMIVALAAFLNGVLSVSGYGIREGRLLVLQCGFALKYDLARLKRIEVNPDAMTGAVPLTFPLLILSPWCKSPLLGVFRAFVTDEKNCVILSFGKKTIVVTPDDPAAFVETLRAELRRMEESAEGNRS